MRRPDEVEIEDAYAAALEQIGLLQQQVIMGKALILKLKREVNDGQEGSGDAGDAGRGHSSHDFSD